jgi:hypothetical protein
MMRPHLLMGFLMILWTGCQRSCSEKSVEQVHTSKVALELVEARLLTETLFIRYRITNPSSETLYFVCLEPECGGAYNLPPMPFVNSKGEVLEISSYVAALPEEAVICDPRSYYLKTLQAGVYEGALVLPLPLHESKPYPIGAETLSQVNVDSLSRVRLRLGYIHCEDAFERELDGGFHHRYETTDGDALRCHGQEHTTLDLQQFMMAEGALMGGK